jgi:hypothetical protein
VATPSGTGVLIFILGDSAHAWVASVASIAVVISFVYFIGSIFD